MGGRFTFPFRYTPHPKIFDASRVLINKIDCNPELRRVFGEGKMMGVLMVEDGPDPDDDGNSFLYAFSGNVVLSEGGRPTALVPGFVPPVFDLTDPSGYFRMEEAAISELSARIKAIELKANPVVELQEHLKILREERKRRSQELQQWAFEHYEVLNAKGDRKSVASVFAGKALVPPGGTGDCAAPKLLQYAYVHGFRPVAMGEFWYGTSPAGEVRRCGCFYPSCMGKCGPLLSFMLEGLEIEDNPLDEPGSGDYEIVFRDDFIVVADKPSGMLAVPGRSLRKSLQELLQLELGPDVELAACHRLDMDTSGLMVFSLDKRTLAAMQQQFESRSVRKSYVALLSAESSIPLSVGMKGRITLPLMPDWYDRPRQMVDFQGGKQAATDYEVLSVREDGRCLLRLVPLTGRTHQLRVHCAHSLGLDRPIAGDSLYGDGNGRLCLHAATLEFAHPVTGVQMHFESNKSF